MNGDEFMIRTYSELCKLISFEERYKYLRLCGKVGDETFGRDRYLNQILYKSEEWKSLRRKIILRDNGCDLGILGREIHDNVYIHHINPLVPDDFKFGHSCLLDPNNLISVSHRTHNAIHFGDESQLQHDPVERRPGDHLPWR